MKRIVPALFVVAVAVFSISVKHRLLTAIDPEQRDSLVLSHTMPAFTLPDRTGKEYQLSAVTKEKKLVLVNFWGTWCAPCRVEMPSFEKMYTDTAFAGLQILAVDEGDSREALDAYLKARPVSFPILIDSAGAFADHLGIQGYPSSVLVDTSGKIIHVSRGLESYFPMVVKNALRARDSSKAVTR